MRCAILLVLAGLVAACTSMSTPPPTAELPQFSFFALRGVSTQVVVLDQRAGERDAAWAKRVETDVIRTLSVAGVTVSPASSTRFEIRLLRARSDFENRQWNGCVAVTGRLVGSREAEATGDACVAKSNLWGKATADNVLRLAYQDAIVRLLSAMDAQLSQ